MKCSESIIQSKRTLFPLNVHISGEGGPILCLSGFGCDHYNFLELSRDLELGGHQLVMVDNRGMGKSPKAVQEYTLRELAFDALGIMEELGHEKFSVFGISMGGFIAQILTSIAAEKVERLGLFCTSGLGPGFIKVPILGEEKLKAFYEMGPANVMEAAVALTTHPTLRRQNPERFNEIVRIRKERLAPLDQVLFQKRAVESFYNNEQVDYRSFPMPTLVLSGDCDRFVDPKNAEEFNRNIPNCTLKYIKQADHFFFMERPRETGRIVSDFLRENL